MMKNLEFPQKIILSQTYKEEIIVCTDATLNGNFSHF